MSGAPRTLLVTGPGGDGVSTVAAATALASARSGRLTLLLSREPADRLGALLGVPADALAGARPVEVAPGLWAGRIVSGPPFRAAVLAAQRQARTALAALGSATLEEDELTELPGAEQWATLAALRAAQADERWARVVVDLPPAVDAVRLLALPGQLRRYLRRLLPQERRAARALRPLLAQLANVPLPAEALLGAAVDWDASLSEAEGLLADPGLAVRLVFEPTARSVALLGTAHAGLALHGIGVEEVLANRLVQGRSPDRLVRALAARQDALISGFAQSVGRSEAPRRVPHMGPDPDAATLAGLLPAPADRAIPRPEPVLEDRLAEDGRLVWRLPLPGAVKHDLDLVRRGDELVVTTGPFRRVLPLPSAPRRCVVDGAAFAHGELAVRFTPDPERWPRDAEGGSEGRTAAASAGPTAPTTPAGSEGAERGEAQRAGGGRGEAERDGVFERGGESAG
ncbi:arsenite efflux ATP-binding protein ArsA [Streptomyces zhaozhouensis]|uniref:Arsenite efflux ATP-binding protein ArsA n=1 Tax=Streptomyces zhaozhouensis TaxID=1300267 RepID=A0A286DJW1_9ACTN|nr:ArsA-related P-loop ATPase [Streptomyces zhaozhouensis]SOD58764.1 arsenite efflux ATP-binding protein ArsA [Streptomyces zhaozhouensis]